MGDALHVSGGVTDAKEARLAQGGLIAVQGPTILDARTGVMTGPGSTSLVTGTASTGPMTVAIAPHVAVTTRGAANGPYLGPVLEASTTVSIAAAPASGSRIDVVYAKQQDATSGVPSPDLTTAPLYGVVTGTSGSSPTKPSLATVVGAVELATVQVAAGATSTNGTGVTITNTAAQVPARGAPVPVRTKAERDALAKYPGLEVVFVAADSGFTAGTKHLCDGTTWHQTFPEIIGVYDAPWTEPPGNLNVTPILITEYTVPDPGVPYRAVIQARVELGALNGASGTSTRWDLNVGYGSSGAAIAVTTAFSEGMDDLTRYLQANGVPSPVLTGALRVAVVSNQAFGNKVGYVGGNKRLTTTLYAA